MESTNVQENQVVYGDARDLLPFQKRMFAQAVADAVLKYYSDPQHRKEYSEQYEKEHGVPYVWRNRAGEVIQDV